MNASLLFVGICYGLAIALSLVVGYTGGPSSPLIALGYVSMFVPAAAVAILSTTRKEPPKARWDALPLMYLPAALILIPMVMHAVMLSAMAMGGGLRWQEWLTRGADGLYHVPASRGWGTLTATGLWGHILLNALAGLVVVSFLAFFEEIGWRAWLLPRLAGPMGMRRAIVATSLIWALWHVPFQLSGIQHIDGVSPVRLAMSMTLGITATGLILGWLWARTESVWLVAIAHGASNNWGQYAFKYMRDTNTPNGDMAALTLGSLAVLIVGAFLVWRRG